MSMGAWGYKPFENDAVLDDLGGFSFADELIQYINECIYKDRWYYPGYECTALLVSTYYLGAKKGFIIDENKIVSVQKLLDKDILTEEEKDLLHESSKAWLSACSIPLIERKQLLIKCTNKLKSELDNPSTGDEYFEKDKFILYMEYVYTTAQEILNSVDNKPCYINSNRLENLIKAYNIPALLTNIEDIAGSVYIQTYDTNKKYHVIKYRHAYGKKYSVTEDMLIKLIKECKIEKPDRYMCMEHLRQYFEKTTKNILKVKCIEKKYEGRKIMTYVIQDEHGRVNVVTSEALKEAIRNNAVECLNLTLTSDNRLISKQGG